MLLLMQPSIPLEFSDAEAHCSLTLSFLATPDHFPKSCSPLLVTKSALSNSRPMFSSCFCLFTYLKDSCGFWNLLNPRIFIVFLDFLRFWLGQLAVPQMFSFSLDCHAVQTRHLKLIYLLNSCWMDILMKCCWIIVTSVFCGWSVTYETGEMRMILWNICKNRLLILPFLMRFCSQ